MHKDDELEHLIELVVVVEVEEARISQDDETRMIENT